VGRPYTISETNHPFPHEFACEGIPILTAYALFHDWDGIYWFTYDWGPLSNPQDGIHKNGWFDVSVDPVKMTNIAACAALWHRQDVRSAERCIVRSYTQDEIIERLRGDKAQERPFYTPGFDRSIPLRHATRFTLDGSASSDFPREKSRDAILSDTGQLGWYNASQKRGVVTVDTAFTAALIGYVKSSGRPTTHLAAEVTNEFCMLLLSSLDARPLGQSSRMLLATTARCGNTGLRWQADRQTLEQWGTGPTVIEPVCGAVRLQGLGRVAAIHVTPLSPTGKRLAGQPTVDHEGETWTLGLKEPSATWYLLELERPGDH
jgi:hypothetical protein